MLSEHIFKHKDLYTYELSEWIEEILYNEFDTISEDNTLDSTADLLIKMSNWLLGRGKSSVEEATIMLKENIEKLMAMSSKKVFKYINKNILIGKFRKLLEILYRLQIQVKARTVKSKIECLCIYCCNKL